MDKVHVVQTNILSNNWYTLKRVTYEVIKDDGSIVTHTREEQAMHMIGSGEIKDAKTIMLLQYVKLHGLV
jgi:hypothetical protein